ncbi:MAG: radical SAM protein [Planctomycetes bacterium]|nr:radical SAM protein [Planctomycetota bacterium]
MSKRFMKNVFLSSKVASNTKNKVILVEHCPQQTVGYTINLLKAAALAIPDIVNHYDIDCYSLSAQEYPFEPALLTHNRKDNTILCEIMQNNPVIIGFSVFVWNYYYFHRFTRMAKLFNPKCKVIWGGKLVENHWEKIMKENPDVDCFCLGEGELVFRNFLLKYLEDTNFKEPLPGTLMKINGQFEKSSLIPQITSLDQLPNPYVKKLINPKKVEMAYIETLRGCLFHCTYCDWGGGNYRTFSDEYVCNLIKVILDQGFKSIAFMDSVFGMKTSRRNKFLKTVLENYNNHSQFAFELRIEMIDDKTAEMFRELARRGGLAKIEIGLQSINKESLKIIKRPLNKKRFIQCYHKLVENAYNVQNVIQIDLIIGFPRETWNSFGEGLNFVFSLDPGVISVFPLEIFPGSEMHSNQMGRYGLIALESPPFSLISTQEMSPQEIQKLYVLCWVATSLRSLIRCSLFYLHHLMDEDIFNFFMSFSDWCSRNGYKNSWFDYGQLEDHAVRLVKYICSEEFKPQVEIDLTCLRHTLLYELASLMVVQSREEDFRILWRHPSPSEFENLGTRTKANMKSTPIHKKVLFWCDKVIEYETHPTTNTEALETAGKSLGILLETYGDTYRKRTITRQEFEAGISYFNIEDIYIAVNDESEQVAGNLKTTEI